MNTTTRNGTPIQIWIEQRALEPINMIMDAFLDFARFVLIPLGIICGGLCYGLARQRGHPRWGCWLWAFMGFSFTLGGLVGALFLRDENDR